MQTEITHTMQRAAYVASVLEMGLEDATDWFIGCLIREKLRGNNGHIGRTAVQLNVHRNTITRHMRVCGINPKKVKQNET